MFERARSPTLWAKVEAEDVDENGRAVMARFHLKFKRLDQNQIKELVEKQKEAGEDDRFFLRNVVEDWKDVGYNGEPLPFSREEFDKLMADGFAPAMLRAFFESLPKARAKN